MRCCECLCHALLFIRQRCGATLQVLLAASLLTGCTPPVELVSSLPESEANEVLGALFRAGIHARKAPNKSGVTIAVDANDTARAIDVLRREGLPRERRAKMGDVFRKDTLVSSPLEERARYLYALSQELEQTLLQIDGVVAARVHVVLPERKGIGEENTPSSASVFLKHREEFLVKQTVPQVRSLVATSIVGLSVEKVTVVLFPARNDVVLHTGKQTNDGGSLQPQATSRVFLALFAGSSLLAMVAVVALGSQVGRRRLKSIFSKIRLKMPGAFR